MSAAWPAAGRSTPDPAVKTATKLLVDRLNSQLYPLQCWDDAYDLAVSMIEAYEAARPREAAS